MTEPVFVSGNYTLRNYACITCGCVIRISVILPATREEVFLIDGDESHAKWHEELEERLNSNAS